MSVALPGGLPPTGRTKGWATMAVQASSNVPEIVETWLFLGRFAVGGYFSRAVFDHKLNDRRLRVNVVLIWKDPANEK